MSSLLSNRRRSLARIQAENAQIIASKQSRPGTNLALRSSGGGTTPDARCTGPIGRTKAAKMTGAQRDSEGRFSDWSKSPNYFCPVERDVRWSK